MTLTTNLSKAIEISRTAISMLERKVYPFDKENVLPDAIIPEGIERSSLEHTIFLLYGCSLDSRRPAERVYAAMRAIAREVDVKSLHQLSRKEISQLIHNYLEKQETEDNQLLLAPEFKRPPKQKAKSQEDPVRTLFNNSRILHDKYQGDPRNFFKPDVNDTVKSLQELTQYGPGKAALYIKNLVRFGVWNYDPCDIPIKVDRHVIRMSLGTGIIETDETKLRSERLVKILTDLFQQITSQERISAIDLDDALWGIGSQICAKNKMYLCEDKCPFTCSVRPQTYKQASEYHMDEEMRESTSGRLF